MKREHKGSLAAGLVLISLGVLFLVVQFVPGLQVYIAFSWPLIIVGIGLLLLIFGVLAGAPGLAVPACIVGGIGVLLYWQNASGNWESWAYAWTLIPGFAGLGVLLSGLLGRENTRQAISSGFWLILISLVMFAIFGSLLGVLKIGGRYWPILLIMLGLLAFAREAGRGGGVVGPVILIGLGAVLLLNNLDLLAWSIWEVVLICWPIVLVAAGLDILIGRRSALGSLLSLVVTLALLVWVVWLFGVEPSAGGTAANAEISQPLGEASQAEIFINPAIGRLHVKALSESANLVEGTIPRGIRDSLKHDFEVEGKKATYRLELGGTSFGPFIGGAGRGVWALGLNPKVPLELDIDLGFGETEVDLTNLQVRDVQVNMGLGQTTVILPDEGNIRAKIEGAIGQTTVIIPQGMAARVHVDTGIAGRELPADYQRQDDMYTSPGFENADNRLELEISQAIGNLTIRHP
jgi:hypothetical protein